MRAPFARAATAETQINDLKMNPSGAGDLSLLDNIDLDADPVSAHAKSSRSKSKPKPKKRLKKRRAPSEPQNRTIEDILAENEKKRAERLSTQLDAGSEFPVLDDFEDVRQTKEPEPLESKDPSEDGEAQDSAQMPKESTGASEKAAEEEHHSSMEEFLRTLEILSRERVPELGPPKDLDEVIAETNATVARALEEKTRDAEARSTSSIPREPVPDSGTLAVETGPPGPSVVEPTAPTDPEPTEPAFSATTESKRIGDDEVEVGVAETRHQEASPPASPPPSPPRTLPPPSSTQATMSVTEPAVTEQLATMFQDEQVVNAQDALDAISALHERLQVHVTSYPEEDEVDQTHPLAEETKGSAHEAPLVASEPDDSERPVRNEPEEAGDQQKPSNAPEVSVQTGKPWPEAQVHTSEDNAQSLKWTTAATSAEQQFARLGDPPRSVLPTGDPNAKTELKQPERSELQAYAVEPLEEKTVRSRGEDDVQQWGIPVVAPSIADLEHEIAKVSGPAPIIVEETRGGRVRTDTKGSKPSSGRKRDRVKALELQISNLRAEMHSLHQQRTSWEARTPRNATEPDRKLRTQGKDQETGAQDLVVVAERAALQVEKEALRKARESFERFEVIARSDLASSSNTPAGAQSTRHFEQLEMKLGVKTRENQELRSELRKLKEQMSRYSDKTSEILDAAKPTPKEKEPDEKDKELENLRQEIDLNAKITREYERDNARLRAELQKKEAEIHDVQRQAAAEKEKDVPQKIRSDNVVATLTKRVQTLEANEMELKFDIDRLSKELERAQERVQKALTAEATVRQVEELSTQLDETKLQHKDEVDSLRKKLSWYAENQELIDANKSRVERLEIENVDLRRTVKMEREALGSAPHVRTTKRIRELEKQVTELEESLRKRHPDSISNLIRAAGPSESLAEKDLAMQQRISELELALETKSEDHEIEMRALQQQHENIVSAYASRIEELERQSRSPHHSPPQTRSPMSDPDGATAGEAPATEDELRAELDRVRQFYTEKLKTLEKKHEGQIRSLKRGDPQPSLPHAGGQIYLDRAVKAEKARKQAEAEVRHLKSLLEQPGKSDSEANDPSDPRKLKALEEETMRLASQLGSANAQLLALQRSPPAAQTYVAPRELEELRQAKATLQHQVESLLSADAVRKIDLENKTRSNLELERQLRELREVAHATPMPPPPPTVSTVEHLTYEMKRLERRLQDREEEVKRAVAEARRSFRYEMTQQEAVHREELREKDLAIWNFKKELDFLMGAFQRLQDKEVSASRESQRAKAQEKVRRMRQYQETLDARKGKHLRWRDDTETAQVVDSPA